MILALTPHAKAAQDLRQEDHPVDEWARLHKPEVGVKGGEAFIPAIFAKSHRTNNNVTHMTALVGDFDSLSRAKYTELVDLVGALPYECWVYETHSHDLAADDCCARVVVPFKEPLRIYSAAQWKAAREVMLEHLGFNAIGVKADEATRDPSRLYFFPRKPTADCVRETYTYEGEQLDPAPFLAAATPWVKVVPTPVKVNTAPLDLEELRRLVKYSDAALRILDGREVANRRADRNPADPEDLNHEDAWLVGTLALVNEAPEGTPAAAIAALCHASFTAEEPDDGRPFEKIERMIEGAIAKRPQVIAQRVKKRAEQDRIVAEIVGEQSRTVSAAINDDDVTPSIYDARTEVVEAEAEIQVDVDGHAPPAEIPSFPATDSGNAARFKFECAGRAAYVEGLGWYVYSQSKGHWVKSTHRAERLAVKVANRIYNEAAALAAADATRANAIWKHAAYSTSAYGIRAMLKIAEALLLTDVAALDGDPWLLNFQDVTVDLRSGESRPHDPKDMITKVAGCRWEGLDAPAPVFTRFLEQVLPDADDRDAVQRAFGYALTGVIFDHVIYFFVGRGRNGKGTLIRAVQAAMGGTKSPASYAREALDNLLLATHNEKHKTALATLMGARFVSCSEINEGRSWDESALKRLSGGDPITANFMRQDPFTYEPTAKLFVQANCRPNVRDTSDGFWSRMRVVEFGVSFAGQEDVKLDEKLRAELPGIAAFLARGCLMWQLSGLKPSKNISAASDAYKVEQDQIGHFLSECTDPIPGAWTPIADLYRRYCTWAEAEGYKHPWTKRAVSAHLEPLGYKKEVRGAAKTFGRLGLVLRPSASNELAFVPKPSVRAVGGIN